MNPTDGKNQLSIHWLWCSYKHLNTKYHSSNLKFVCGCKFQCISAFYIHMHIRNCPCWKLIISDESIRKFHKFGSFLSCFLLYRFSVFRRKLFIIFKQHWPKLPLQIFTPEFLIQFHICIPLTMFKSLTIVAISNPSPETWNFRITLTSQKCMHISWFKLLFIICYSMQKFPLLLFQ